MSDSKQTIKEGELTVKSGILKQKHKRWGQLCRDKEGVVVLDCYESKDQKDKVKSSFTLSHVKNIDKVVKESSKDYYIEIHLRKEKFSLIFNNTNDIESWYTSLQNHSEFSEGREDSSYGAEEDDTTLKDNVLYDSQPDDSFKFDVRLKSNEDTEHLGLNSRYRLHVSHVCLMLEDLVTQEQKFKWYYEHLRKYGRQGQDFVIMSGRRSDSGPGTFIFIHEDAAKIVKAIDKLTHRKHNEQLSSKLNFQHDAEKPPLNRTSEPIHKTEVSPVPQRKGTSLKEDNISKTPLSRQHSAHMSTDFKHELEVTVNKTVSEKSSKSKKERSEKDKKGFGFFKKDRKSKEKGESEKEEKDSRHTSLKERLYDEPEPDVKTTTEPLYEEADQDAIINRQDLPSSGKKALKPPEPNLYAQANPGRKNAWKDQGMLEEHHHENYAGIKAAASQKGQRKSIEKNESEEIDDTYDHAFLSQKNLKKKTAANNSNNIYGKLSGKEIQIPEPDYDEENAYELGDDEEEQCEYDDAVSAQSLIAKKQQIHVEAYEEVDIKS